MTPIDIAKILTAATPIVAYMISGSKVGDITDKKEPNVNVTINNNFYVNSHNDAVNAANLINNQIIDSIGSNKTRYTI